MTCHAIGISQPNEKVMKHILMPVLKKKESKWIRLRDDLHCYLDFSLLYIFHNHSLSYDFFGEKGWYNNNIKVKVNEKINIGKWTVELIVELTNSEIALDRKLIFSEIVTGKFSYCLPHLIGDEEIEYVIDNNKKKIPQTLKGSGLNNKMKLLFPIVCINNNNEKVIKSNTSVIRVKYRFFN